MITIRVGKGRSSNGTILDRDTHWYQIKEYEHAIEYAIESEKPIFISSSGGYREVTFDQLQKLYEKYGK